VSQRLLIADDHATARRLLRAMLETRAGWQVCGEAENGLEAVAKTAELKPDVIILDLAMPLMDGLHAAQRISATSPTVPILMYTTHNFEGLDLEAKKVGVLKVISKTASADALLMAIEEALNATVPQASPQGVVSPASAIKGKAEKPK
jgi:DNA-binding NarL/FixJ family response regulator